MKIMNNINTLTKNNQFKRIYSKGKNFVSPSLVTYVIKNRQAGIYYGITTSKKVGIAVKRNRARRLIKESFKLLSPYIKDGYSIVFVARAKTPYVKCQTVTYEMKKHLSKAGVLK